MSQPSSRQDFLVLGYAVLLLGITLSAMIIFGLKP